MSIDISIFTANIGAISHGFLVTLWTWLGGVALSIILGFLIAVVQLFSGRYIRALIRVFTEIIRSTPFLIQLFILYYGGPSISITLNAITAGLVGLAIYGSVYFAEIFRSGFNSIPKGQIEAADCLGMKRPVVIWRIQVRQMLVLVVPAMINMLIVLLKETPVLSIITVPELTMVMTGIGSSTFAYAEVLLILCIAYWFLAEVTARIGRAVEKHIGRYQNIQPIRNTTH